MKKEGGFFLDNTSRKLPKIFRMKGYHIQKAKSPKGLFAHHRSVLAYNRFLSSTGRFRGLPQFFAATSKLPLMKLMLKRLSPAVY